MVGEERKEVGRRMDAELAGGLAGSGRWEAGSGEEFSGF